MTFEDKLAYDMMNSWIAMELVSCGFPMRCPEDLKGLQFAIAKQEVSVVTYDVRKIQALSLAIDVFIGKFAEIRDSLIRAALVLAFALQVSAQEALERIDNYERN